MASNSSKAASAKKGVSAKTIIWGGLAVVAIVVAVVLLTTPKNETTTNVDSAGVREAVAAGATILDVRSQGEYAAGHMPGAVWVSDADYQNVLNTMDKSASYVVYCASGSRSAAAVAYMESAGFTSIYHLSTGLVSWDGQLVGGNDPGDVSLTLQAADGSTNTDGLAAALADPMVAPAGTPVLVEFRTDS